MPFDQDDLPRIELVQNPLKMVVAQLRFPAELSLNEPETMAAFQARLRDQYPIALPRQAGIRWQVQIPPGPSVVVPAPQQVPFEGPLRFTDGQNNWVASFDETTLSLETKAYLNGEQFRARWARLIEVFLELVSPARVDRFGIRYVNQLWHPGVRSVEDWGRFLRPELMGAIASTTLSARVIRSSGQIWLAVGDDGGSIRHLYAQNPERVEPPSTVLLDFDLFSAGSFPFNSLEIMTRFDRYHKWAWNLFRQSITDEMVESLGVNQE